MGTIPKGTVIDDVRIESVLGEGGMGVVYKGTQISVGDRPVAIKFLKQDAFPDIETLKQATDRMRDEAIAASSVNSRHLVNVFQAGHSDEHGFYIVFEYLKGQTLSERIQAKGPLSQKEIIRAVAKPMLLALIALHDKNILHRDIKPANIQADERKRYRLSDLGLAYFGDRNAKTATGTFIGTPGYLAPERLNGIETKASDVYSAAMTLVYASTGRLPFTTKGYNIFQEQVNTPITPIKLTTMGVPASLAKVLAPALALVPVDRPTAKDFLHSLDCLPVGKALDLCTKREREKQARRLHDQKAKNAKEMSKAYIACLLIAIILVLYTLSTRSSSSPALSPVFVKLSKVNKNNRDSLSNNELITTLASLIKLHRVSATPQKKELIRKLLSIAKTTDISDLQDTYRMTALLLQTKNITSNQFRRYMLSLLRACIPSKHNQNDASTSIPKWIGTFPKLMCELTYFYRTNSVGDAELASTLAYSDKLQLPLPEWQACVRWHYYHLLCSKNLLPQPDIKIGKDTISVKQLLHTSVRTRLTNMSDESSLHVRENFDGVETSTSFLFKRTDLYNRTRLLYKQFKREQKRVNKLLSKPGYSGIKKLGVVFWLAIALTEAETRNGQDFVIAIEIALRLLKLTKRKTTKNHIAAVLYQLYHNFSCFNNLTYREKDQNIHDNLNLVVSLRDSYPILNPLLRISVGKWRKSILRGLHPGSWEKSLLKSIISLEDGNKIASLKHSEFALLAIQRLFTERKISIPLAIYLYRETVLVRWPLLLPQNPDQALFEAQGIVEFVKLYKVKTCVHPDHIDTLNDLLEYVQIGHKHIRHPKSKKQRGIELDRIMYRTRSHILRKSILEFKERFDKI